MHTTMYIYIFIDVGSTFTVHTVNHVILPRLLKYQGPSLYYVSKETGQVGLERWQFLLTINTIYAYVGWVGQKKIKKCADVIQGWSLGQANNAERYKFSVAEPLLGPNLGYNVSASCSIVCCHDPDCCSSNLTARNCAADNLVNHLTYLSESI